VPAPRGAQLGHLRAKGAGGVVATGVGRDVVAEDAVVVPAGDVTIERAAAEARAIRDRASLSRIVHALSTLP